MGLAVINSTLLIIVTIILAFHKTQREVKLNKNKENGIKYFLPVFRLCVTEIDDGRTVDASFLQRSAAVGRSLTENNSCPNSSLITLQNSTLQRHHCAQTDRRAIFMKPHSASDVRLSSVLALDLCHCLLFDRLAILSVQIDLWPARDCGEKQEAQLSPRDRATRALCQLKSCQLLHSCTKSHTWKDLQQLHDLKGHSTSSELPLFDRPYITSS